jgi:HEXXH motif-containing protein
MAIDRSRVVAAHAVLGDVEQLLAMRRAVYSGAVELFFGPEVAGRAERAVLDNPVVRAHLAQLLAGRGEPDSARLTSIGALLAGQRARTFLPVAASPAARTHLAGALEEVRRELALHGDHSPAGTLLTVDDPDFGAAQRVLTAGIELARDVVPELVDDLQPHAALFALVAPDAAGRLGSASLRDWPGLIVLPRPGRPIEAAEALLHEGAHQKLFDLMLTRSMLAARTGPEPLFAPPWRPEPAPRWPLDQCLAALHTYCVLAAAAPAFAERGVALHEHSLLPHAATRAELLAEWWERQWHHLGPDGRRFVTGLTGSSLPADADGLDESVRRPDAAVVRHCGSWDLHLSAGSPSDLWWVPNRKRRVTVRSRG